MNDRPGRAVCPQTADSLESLCAAHAPMAPGGRFAAGTVFGDWRLTAFIGRGGNGEVYCAEHVTLGTPAAVKVLVRDEERAKVRFEREAKIGVAHRVHDGKKSPCRESEVAKCAVRLE